MNVQIELTGLIEKLNSLFTNPLLAITPEMEIESNILIKHKLKQSQIDGQSFTLFDINSKQVIAHISPEKNKVNQVCFSLKEVQSDPFLLNVTHPDDKVFLIKLLTAVYSYIMTLNKEQKERFEFIFQHRIMISSTDFQCQIRKLNIVLSDENGHPCQIMITSEPCFVMSSTYHNRYRIFGIKPNVHIKHFKEYCDFEIIKLTNREKEILPLIGNGYTKAEIGIFLFINTKTVCKHIINAQLFSILKFHSINFGG